MKHFLGVLAKLLLFFAVFWFGTVAYWRYTNRVVSSEDLIVFFCVLPLLVLLIYGVLRMLWWGVKKIRTPRVAMSASGSGNQVQAAQTLPGRQAVQAIHVLSSVICTPLGPHANDYLTAAGRYEDAPRRDVALSDALDWAVRAARIHAIAPEVPSREAREAVLRIRALLVEVCHALAPDLNQYAGYLQHLRHAQQQGIDAARLHPEWLGAIASVEHPTSGSADVTVPAALTLLLLLPGFMTPEEVRLCEMEIEAWALETGWPKVAMHTLNIAVSQELEGLRQLNALWEPSSTTTLVGVLSAVSWLDEALLGQIFQADPAWQTQLQKGTAVLGECGVGLLFCRDIPQHPVTREKHKSLAKIFPLELAERDKPIDAKGILAAQILNDLLSTQLTALHWSAEAVQFLVVSGDYHQGRGVELGKWMTDQLPHLSPVENTLYVGQGLGACVPASDLLGMALAVAQAEAMEACGLFVSNHSTRWRALTVVMPSTQEASVTAH